MPHFALSTISFLRHPWRETVGGEPFDRISSWKPRGLFRLREYFEVIAVTTAVTAVGWFTPVTYRAFGHVYLLSVIMLCLRVGRWPGLFAAFLSAIAWNYFIMPPRLSFSTLDLEDDLMLGTHFIVALIAVQLTTRIRADELLERARKQRATALFHLTRALTGARTLDEAVTVALRQADELFGARSALLLRHENSGVTPHPASSFVVTDRERKVADWVVQHRHEAGRFTAECPWAGGLHVPMMRAGEVLGVFVIAPPVDSKLSTPEQHDLIETFAAQIALFVERDRWRAAAEREKLLEESDRLHRTLLDCVSHELRTPLAVLRSAAENLDTSEPARRANVATEIHTATRRLDHLVGNLLNQTRLESGAVKPQLDWCDARDLVQAARRGLGDALAGRTLSLEIPATLPLFLADAPLMEQVLANLLLNAARHTPPGTAVKVSAGVAGDDHRVFIAIADRGPGIPPEERAGLFAKFQRGKDARAGGVGLGLSIVRGFMVAQGGSVDVDENPGGGTRFTIYLPGAAHGEVPGE